MNTYVFRRSYVLVALSLWLGAVWAQAAANLYPDPGFEGSGREGVVRTGTRSGHLKVDAQSHWNAIDRRLDVVPFARYRACVRDL